MKLFKHLHQPISGKLDVTESILARQKFYDDAAKLGESIVFKSKVLAEDINRRLIANRIPVDETNETTWKHYLEIGGVYPSGAAPIQIMSLDTATMIDFTTDNLNNHPFTKRHYTYGSDPYKELILHNQTVETVLKSAVLGITHSQVLAAPDMTILGYNESLVQEHEVSLIPKLNRWLRLMDRRWYMPSYHLVDEYYITASLINIQLNLTLAIIAIREELQHTQEVHSFFIVEELIKHDIPRERIANLPRKSQLFLYRNIDYIKRHIGFEKTHKWVYKNLLVDNGVYVADTTLSEINKYNSLVTGGMEHNVKHDPRIDSPLTPLTEVTKTFINDMAELYPGEYEHDGPQFDDEFVLSLVNTHRTKQLYIDPRLVAHRHKVTYDEYVVDQWALEAANGNLEYNVRLKLYDDKVITVTPLQAFIIWLYVVHLIINKEIMRIPYWVCKYAPNYADFNLTEFQASVVNNSVSVDELTTMWGDMPSNYPYYNSDQFLYRVRENYVNLTMMLDAASVQGNIDRQHSFIRMANYFHGEKTINLADRAYYNQWLNELGVETLPTNKRELQLFANYIIKETIGYDNELDVEKAVKTALVRVSESLLPYTTHLNDVNLDRPILVGSDNIKVKASIVIL